MPSTNVSKVPPGRRCESDEGSADNGVSGEPSNSPDGAGVGELSDSPDGACIGEPSDSADGIPSECDGEDKLVETGLLRKERPALILSRIDSNLRFGIADEAIARRR